LTAAGVGVAVGATVALARAVAVAVERAVVCPGDDEKDAIWPGSAPQAAKSAARSRGTGRRVIRGA
jgi:hypothetical protein